MKHWRKAVGACLAKILYALLCFRFEYIAVGRNLVQHVRCFHVRKCCILCQIDFLLTVFFCHSHQIFQIKCPYVEYSSSQWTFNHQLLKQNLQLTLPDSTYTQVAQHFLDRPVSADGLGAQQSLWSSTIIALGPAHVEPLRIQR
jgi:hypothetical protein